MGVAPPATLGGFAPAATHIITHAIIYALITVTNNYTAKKTRVGQGAKPPQASCEATSRAWWAAQRPSIARKTIPTP
jgi:hypothetical protein